MEAILTRFVTMFTATLLAIVPYGILRELVNRIARTRLRPQREASR